MIIEINKSPNADSRTAVGKVSYEDFCKATDMHRDDVKRVMYELARRLREIADMHDFTKKTTELEYYESYINAMKNGTDFHNSDWYKNHTRQERHHINRYVANDINLLDTLEYIVDQCYDSVSEKGKIGKIEIDDDVLMKAFNNTVDLAKGSIRLGE